MTINPCCIPLKMGVRMVTHLSMALALAVGWTALKLISISQQVSSEVSTTEHFQPGGGTSPTNAGDVVYYKPQTFPYPPQPYPHPEEGFGQQQQWHEIPYEYFLYHKWHQQQLQQQQQQNRQSSDGFYGRPGGYQQTGSSSSPAYPYHRVPQDSRTWPRPPAENEEQYQFPPKPVLPPSPPQQPPPLHFQREGRASLASSSLSPPVAVAESEDDEHSKIFRSVLRQRKNFKEPPGRRLSSTAGEDEKRSSSSKEKDEARVDELRALPSNLPSENSSREKGSEIVNDKPYAFPPFYLAPLPPLRSPHHPDEHGPMTRGISPGRSGSVSSWNTTPPNYSELPEFQGQYAKVLLICGLLAVCTVVFQFLTSFLLFCFLEKGSNAAAQIWTAVNCSVIFCLATCLVLFLCEGVSMPKYLFDETLYLSLVTLDSLLSIYFLWVVMAFI